MKKRNEIELQMITMTAEERVILTLKLISVEIAKGEANNKVVLPNWANVVTIAKLSNCSRTIASASIQRLLRKGIIKAQDSSLEINTEKLAFA